MLRTTRDEVVVIFTDVDEVGPVLAGHAETKIPPEPCVLLDHLQAREGVLESL